MKIRIIHDGKRFYITPADEKKEEGGFDMEFVDTFTQGQQDYAGTKNESEGTYFSVFLPDWLAGPLIEYQHQHHLDEDQLFEVIASAWLATQ